MSDLFDEWGAQEHRGRKALDYYHKVVDCQYACPTHTPVPEYIRLIGQRRFRDAYLINRDSNVFPGILGRVCDRPCEPACRRGRVENEPVAICRLKRVAADFKGDIEPFLPKKGKPNGFKVAVIGAGPAGLTVINDLAPLGYELTLFERAARAGGAILSQVPSFRLPDEVLREETDVILRLAHQVHFDHEVKALSSLLDDFDAVVVGIGAPVGKSLNLEGSKEFESSILVGVEFLANVTFDHKPTVGRQVVVIGGGNTAMDCARTALRFGADQVTIVAPETREQMLASPWEIHDALEENIAIKNNLLPQAFTGEGLLSGVRFQPLVSCYDQGGRFAPKFSDDPEVLLPCSTVILAIGQLNNFDFIDQPSSVEIDRKRQLPALVPDSQQSASNPKVFFAGDAAQGPRNIISAVADGHNAAQGVHGYLNPEQPARESQMSWTKQRMTMNQWRYSNDYSQSSRRIVPTIPIESRRRLDAEVETGFSQEEAALEVSRCLNCDVHTVFNPKECIECNACVHVCPVECLAILPQALEELLRSEIKSTNPDQGLFTAAVPQTHRLMVKDENICIHCGLCAERCPTSAWDMQRMAIKFPHDQRESS